MSARLDPQRAEAGMGIVEDDSLNNANYHVLDWRLRSLPHG
jgi:hypothetical protein